MRMIRQLLNRLLFSSNVHVAPDVVSAWESVLLAYLRNLIIAFLSVAAILAASSHYQPFIAPLNGPNLRLILVISNFITFFLTFMASLRWHPSLQATERQRAENRSRGEYLVLLTAFWATSSAFLIGTLIDPTFSVVLGGAVVHSALFQLMISQRAPSLQS